VQRQPTSHAITADSQQPVREIEFNEAEYERGITAAAAGEQGTAAVKAPLDERLSPQIAAFLRQTGLDIEAVAVRPDLIGRTDMVIFEVACSEDGAVVTNNIRDFRLHSNWQPAAKAGFGAVAGPAASRR
jgi:predicted nucleic acid-binding protein